MSKNRVLPNPTVAPEPAASVPAEPGGNGSFGTMFSPPSTPGLDVQFSEGGERGDRPGPKPVARVGDVSTAVGTVSAADLNDRKWEGKKTALRALVQEESEKLAAEQPRHSPLFGKAADEPIGDEVVEEAPEEPVVEVPKAKDAELAALAEKDRENRKLRRELKKVAESPKTDQVVKLRKLAKENPRGVAEFLGIPLEALNMAFLAGGEVQAIKLEDDVPPRDAERERLEKERDQARSEAAEVKAREARRSTADVVAKKVAEMKGEDGKPRWGNIARIGDEGRAAALEKAFGFVGGTHDENGQKLATPRRMKPLGEKDAHAVLEHFLDIEEQRLGRLASKLSPASGKPTPRRAVNGAFAPARERPAFDPNNPHDPNNPRNRPTYREIGDKVRERFFGRR